MERAWIWGVTLVSLSATMIGCKGKKADASEATGAPSSAPTATATATAAAPSWVDKVTGEGFSGWVSSHPGGCDCSVKETKQQGSVSVVSWEIHRPGDDHYMSFVTTVSEHGGAGSKLSYDLSNKYPGCINSQVGNKVIVSTRCVAAATSAMFPNGKHEVKPCQGSGWSIPEGMQQYFEAK
ncbi:MAG: hypothetical protein HYZ29_12370 [Myxococcales bacterium]|nr:hypothetical protein [Myxococcales bacterium]